MWKMYMYKRDNRQEIGDFEYEWVSYADFLIFMDCEVITFR